MSDNLQNLSLSELAQLIENAQSIVKDKQRSERKSVIAKIRELAASIDVSVEIIEGSKPVRATRGSKVAAKYRNPANSEQTWTGRGIKPKWLSDLLNQGRDIREFLI